MTYDGKMSIKTRLRPVNELFGDSFPNYIDNYIDAAFYDIKTSCAYIFKGIPKEFFYI
jgi:hypothetical protein